MTSPVTRTVRWGSRAAVLSSKVVASMRLSWSSVRPTGLAIAVRSTGEAQHLTL